MNEVFVRLKKANEDTSSKFLTFIFRKLKCVIERNIYKCEYDF